MMPLPPPRRRTLVKSQTSWFWDLKALAVILFAERIMIDGQAMLLSAATPNRHRLSGRRRQLRQAVSKHTWIVYAICYCEQE